MIDVGEVETNLHGILVSSQPKGYDMGGIRREYEAVVKDGLRVSFLNFRIDKLGHAAIIVSFQAKSFQSSLVVSGAMLAAISCQCAQ
jgi:hypothetical protein